VSHPVPFAPRPVHRISALLVALLAAVGLVFASPSAVAQDKEKSDEKSEEKAGDEADSADEAGEEDAPTQSATDTSRARPEGDRKARAKPVDPSLKEAPGPAGWPAGKPPGPGPEGGDAEGSEAEGGGEGWSADDGIGVGCKDYIDCVCTIARLSKGKTIGGYSHDGTCKVAKTYTTPEYEELCASELNEVKDTLEDAKEDYKANGIELPAACQ